ncbi:MAG: NAD(P)H-binding protein [Planctomycetes bacterium]|nr:NAD(P)H-binding protein [Planctomycetota bacterium]MBI3848175.1 NAD(P)H-binding protein [Planctomycetota bacterium]
MRCFVTGATGLLGREVVKSLVADKHEVVALVRRDDQADAAQALGARAARGDVLSRDTLTTALRGVECVLHFAGSRPCEKDGERVQQLDVDGTRNVAEAAIAAGAKRLVFASTITIAGDLRSGKLDESSPDKPGHGFARAKHDAEQVLASMKGRGLDVAFLRIAHAYGVGGGFQPLLDTILDGKLVLPAREVFWGWASPEDVGRAASIAAAKAPAGERLVVSDDLPSTTADVLDYVARLLRLEMPKRGPAALARLRLGADRFAYLSESAKPTNAKLKALGWTSVYGRYREGVAAQLAGGLLERDRQHRPSRVPFFKVSEKAPNVAPDLSANPNSKKPTPA